MRRELDAIHAIEHPQDVEVREPLEVDKTRLEASLYLKDAFRAVRCAQPLGYLLRVGERRPNAADRLEGVAHNQFHNAAAMLAPCCGRRGIRYDPNVAALVRSGSPDNDDSIGTLHARLAELQATLGEREDEIARAQSDLASFRIRYHRDVGLLHEELDELERAIAEAELGELSKLVEDGAAGSATPSLDGGQPEGAARLTSDAVRKLFRDVAKTIHPDLARDEQTRDRRHALMAEANRAYALGDEERLRWILDSWERGPEAVQGSDPESTRLRLERRIAQIDEQLNACARDLAELHDSPLWKLKVMVDDAAARGKDLVADMVRRLKRDITASRNRLEAMRWNP